jgi:hypothetical protein
LSANISKLRLGAVSGYDISLAVVAAAEAETQDAEMPPEKSQKAVFEKAKGKQTKPKSSPPSQSSKPLSQVPSLADQFEVEGSRAVSRKNWPVSKPGAITERVNEPKHSQDKTGVGRFSEMSNAEFGRFVLKLFAELKVSTEDQSKLCRVVGDVIIFNSYVNSEGKRKTTWIDQKLYDRLTPFQRAAFAEMKTRTINYAKQLKGESVSRISSEDKSKVKASSGKSFSKSKSKRGARVNLSAAASDSESGSQTSSRSSSKSDASLREFLDLDRDQLHSESEMEPSRMDRKKWLSSRSSTGRTQREREDFSMAVSNVIAIVLHFSMRCVLFATWMICVGVIVSEILNDLNARLLWVMKAFLMNSRVCSSSTSNFQRRCRSLRRSARPLHAVLRIVALCSAIKTVWSVDLDLEARFQLLPQAVRSTSNVVTMSQVKAVRAVQAFAEAIFRVESCSFGALRRG